jgi:hypothetical protein
MAEATEDHGPTPAGTWTRRISYLLSALPAAMLVMSAGMKLSGNRQAMEQASSQLGWPPTVMFALGLVELGCTVIYLVPRTSVLGAVLLTGYLGGAVATHVRVGDPFVAPLAVGVVVWLALWLREPRLKALLPLR